MSIIGRFKRLIFGASPKPGPRIQSSKTVRNEYRFSERDKLVAQKGAEDALQVFTESLNIANKSKNLETRESRLQVARDKLVELKKMEKQFPFLHLENLQAVEASIAEVAAETRELIAAQPKSKIFTTNEESQNNKIELWKANDDIIKGLEFCATMRLRTPLRVLLRHGEIHTNPNTKPPKIAMEMWEGIWTTKTQTYRELGIDIDEPQGTCASDIGQIPQAGGEYLKFLIEVRKIVELDESIENRIEKLREMPMVSDWKTYVEKHGGIETISGRFFPEFIDTIPKISATIDELSELGLETPNRIAAAPDETLLSIKGIGQSKLKTIRDYCAGITKNRDADRVENVIR